MKTAKTRTEKPNLAAVQKLFYRREEASFALGLSVRTIDGMIAEQRLRTRRKGRCVLIPASDIQRVADEIMSKDMI
jgi:excisionase family DNA binding protein